MDTIPDSLPEGLGEDIEIPRGAPFGATAAAEWITGAPPGPLGHLVAAHQHSVRLGTHIPRRKGVAFGTLSLTGRDVAVAAAGLSLLLDAIRRGTLGFAAPGKTASQIEAELVARATAALDALAPVFDPDDLPGLGGRREEE